MTAERRRRPAVPAWAWVLTGLAVVGLGVFVAVVWKPATGGRAPVSRGVVSAPDGTAPVAAENPRGRPASSAEDQAREQFIALVKRNAPDPAGLEIIEWGDRVGSQRTVRFRCKLIGLTRSGKFQPGGAVEVGGDPIMLDFGTIEYDGDKIKYIYLEHLHGFWYPAATASGRGS